MASQVVHSSSTARGPLIAVVALGLLNALLLADTLLSGGEAVQHLLVEFQMLVR